MIILLITLSHNRRGVRTELTERGPRAGAQLDKLTGLLKDPPVKPGLKAVQEIPALDVVHNQGRGEECGRVYIPGPQAARSLKIDNNVIPITAPNHSNQQDFR